MKIYGVGLLAFCFLVGKLLGLGLGRLINLSNDVGGGLSSFIDGSYL